MTPLGPRDPDRAGPYELLGRLGAGGQGVVYLGREQQAGFVAVKMINLDLHHNPRAKAQFAKEIAAARRVAPFCTAQILFADVDSDPPYVVSEYIEGPTLQRHVREYGPVTGNALHRLAVGTATALAAIHQSDVVHCDLKPDNVVLGADGARVIDFGIARALDVTETMTSRIMGTAPYMAPERFRDDEVGPASDVFAWAATIAFAAAGRPPFGTGTVVAVMNRVLHDPPDLAGLSGPLSELVGQCLDKDHRARPPAEQVLLRLLGHTPHAGAPVPIQTALRAGTDAAATQLVPRQPTAYQPTTHEPTGQPPTAYQATGQPPTAYQPASYQATAPSPTTYRPAAQGPARDTWSRRLRRQYADAWGISAAIFLGAAGGAAGYVATTAATTAAAVGAMTFVVVYGVRLLVATALPGAAAPAAPAPDGSGAAPTPDRGGPTAHPGA
ncbi:serine/threonine-protein kinase [Micromonospora rubida]|uniref:serine/threonine-protein kinase n=1 Tax=Micromonospora rubida TaxID=2697657 RepID=UPI0013773C50|nr:serine/threonine-protein kinase [Micromonospora rubida]NBE83679.1 protein kinase [Micromonospora rubida]